MVARTACTEPAAKACAAAAKVVIAWIWTRARRGATAAWGLALRVRTPDRCDSTSYGPDVASGDVECPAKAASAADDMPPRGRIGSSVRDTASDARGVPRLSTNAWSEVLAVTPLHALAKVASGKAADWTHWIVAMASRAVIGLPFDQWRPGRRGSV